MATIIVTSTASLTSALKAAVGGDTIKLMPGTYSGLNVKALSFSSDVTITSADPARPAVITNFTLTDVKGLTFTNLDMTANNPTGAASSSWAFAVSKSNDIHFNNIKFHGSLDGDSGNDMNGLSISGSQNISVTNSEFQQFGRGLPASTSQNLDVSGNKVHHMRSDGFDFAAVGHVKLTNNSFRDFDPVGGDHPDAIQFWTSGTTVASHDILISGNVIMRGDGANTQGIFLRDQIGTLPYQRVTISDNLIVGTGANGIRVMGAKDLTVTGNELISFAGGDKTTLLIQDAVNVRATANSGISVGFLRTTDLVESANVTTSPVNDGGLAALTRWVQEHPTAATHLPSFLLPVSNLQPFGEAPPHDVSGFDFADFDLDLGAFGRSDFLFA